MDVFFFPLKLIKTYLCSLTMGKDLLIDLLVNAVESDIASNNYNLIKFANLIVCNQVVS